MRQRIPDLGGSNLPRANQAPPPGQFVAGMLAAGAATAASALEGDRGGWQIGCYTRPWADHDYRLALDGIAAAGFHYAGLMTAKSKDHLIISANTAPEQAAAVAPRPASAAWQSSPCMAVRYPPTAPRN